MFNIKSLTLGEVAKVEELSGLGIGVLGEDETPKGKMMAALAFVIRRREDPTFKWNDALALTMHDANAILGLNDNEPDSDEPDVGQDDPQADEGPTS